MTVSYQLHLERFEGPLEKLLELIEDRKLDVTEVSLAAVTDDFLRYLKSLEKVETPVLADFIAIASRLILIKSKSLLPDLTLTEEETSDIKDLEERLKVYRELRPAQKFLQGLWREGRREWSRPYFLAQLPLLVREEGFYPSDNLTKEMLFTALEKIVEAARAGLLETETIKEKIISLEEKIGEVVERLKKGEASFRGLAHKKSRGEIIIIFLALLHLAREQLISLEQKHYFSDIMIKKT